ncbi:hypothetical protein ACFOOP_15010 [Marinicaulis aureus]|uniref:Uncharacterized protein n=1 Tax=Hyphococcus aureus TaxID=2666033 RepID=A0ABW1KXV0_9PROT
MRAVVMFVVWMCAIIWVAFAVQGVFAYLTLDPTGSGFTRGSNRISAFFQWEALALGAAVVGFLVGGGLAKGDISRFAARWPLYLSGGFFAALIILFVGAIIIARLAG